MPFLTVRGRLFHVIHGFDRVTLWFNLASLPKNLKAQLKLHCRRVKANVRQMKNNPLWKFKLRVFQPAPAFFRVLLDAIGGVRVLITYIEIARDIEPGNPDDLARLEAAFLACVTIPRLHRPAVRRFKCAYYFNRAHKDGVKNRDVPVMYADKPSKQPVRGRAIQYELGPDDPKCLHVEWRRHGSAAIGDFGISSIGDLLAFDFEAFFAQRMPFMRLPDSQTELGRMLPGKRGVNADSLRKRARAFLSVATLKKSNLFVLQDALRQVPAKFAAKLQFMTLEEWLDHAMDEHARWR